MRRRTGEERQSHKKHKKDGHNRKYQASKAVPTNSMKPITDFGTNKANINNDNKLH